MSSRQFNSSIVAAGAMVSTINSTATVLDFSQGFSIQAIVTASSGPVTGTFTLQASDDDTSATPTNWTTISGSSAAVSGNGSAFWDYASPKFQHVRLVYTATSGTGTLNARIKYLKIL